jgi:signal transduction histidine kinase
MPAAWGVPESSGDRAKTEARVDATTATKNATNTATNSETRTDARPAAPAELESTLSRLRGALSRSTVERILTRAAAVFGLLLSLQAIPVVTASTNYIYPVWLDIEPLVLLAVLLLVVLAAVLQRGVRVTMTVFSLLYLVAFALWPLCISNLSAAAGTQPWLWSLIAVAMAYAAVALPVPWAGAYIVAVTAVYVFIHVQPSGGSAELKGGLLDAIYVLLIGAFMVMLTTTLRRAADRVDAAQATAMQQYARAARNHATEVERTKIDALVHDTVLTTLITAARAETDTERAAAVTLSAAALETLQDAPGSFDPDSDVTLTQFATRLAEAAHVLSPRVAFAAKDLAPLRIRGVVADALFSAAVQALINSLQHAGDRDGGPDVMRTITVKTEFAEQSDAAELTVQVSDTGVGFDVSEVPKERLGLRVSIRERVESVGGRAVICSMPGGGTSIVVTWKAADL